MHMNTVFIICSLLVGENRKRKLSVASQFSITIAETFINFVGMARHEKEREQVDT